jgi:DNA-binding transcriptional ArsR family regulator
MLYSQATRLRMTVKRGAIVPAHRPDGARLQIQIQRDKWCTLRKVCTMNNAPVTLNPTLWRTCRALANRRRLKLLRHLITHGPGSVQDIAVALRIPVPTASEGLRALNARGLLTVTRRGRHVTYGAGDDPLLPEARELLQALTRELPATKRMEPAFAALTGFTHPRRIALVRAVARGATSLRAVCARTAIPLISARRHLSKLMRRGYLRSCVEGRKRTFGLGHPPSPLAQALLRLVVS